MKLFKLALLAGVLLANIASAENNAVHKAKFEIVVQGDGTGRDSATIWSSDQMDFDLDAVAIGETKTFTDESGETVTVSRSDSGYTFDVAGKSIEIPNFENETAHMEFLSIDGIEHEFDIGVADESRMMAGHGANSGIIVFSPEPLNASVRESIKSVLVSAGNNNEVTFVDNNQHEKRVMVVKKEIEVFE